MLIDRYIPRQARQPIRKAPVLDGIRGVLQIGLTHAADVLRPADTALLAAAAQAETARRGAQQSRAAPDLVDEVGACRQRRYVATATGHLVASAAARQARGGRVALGGCEEGGVGAVDGDDAVVALRDGLEDDES